MEKNAVVGEVVDRVVNWDPSAYKQIIATKETPNLRTAVMLRRGSAFQAL